MIKTIFGIIAVILTFIGYVPYIWSIIKGNTKPHIYSWLVWLLDAFIIFALQITYGAGASAFVMLAVGLLCLTVLILTIVKKGKSEIKLVDSIFLIFALIALAIWLLAKQPLVSALLITFVDLFGFVPTVRKSWHKPHSENAYFYTINALRFTLALVALQEYSIITIIYPAVWLVANGLFAIMLIARQKLVK